MSLGNRSASAQEHASLELNLTDLHEIIAMCALAARFSDQAKGNKANAGNAFMDKACNLLISALRLPNTDAVTSLLLMAQCEFGQNNESGAWVSCWHQARTSGMQT